jgi:hypothetical protein
LSSIAPSTASTSFGTTVRFLYTHGGRAPEGYYDAVWGALLETDEESLADAASALRDGTITRREFEDGRSSVHRARAKFDAEVDAALAEVEVIADA